jgi:hypothetical protein
LLAPGRAPSGRYSERGPRRPSLHAPRAWSRAHGSKTWIRPIASPGASPAPEAERETRPSALG